MYKLLDENNKVVLSEEPGKYGGHSKLKIYGHLNCSSAARWLSKGHYSKHRVFFLNEETAIKAGYRPCALCMNAEYMIWKRKQK